MCVPVCGRTRYGLVFEQKILENEHLKEQNAFHSFNLFCSLVYTFYDLIFPFFFVARVKNNNKL